MERQVNSSSSFPEMAAVGQLRDTVEEYLTCSMCHDIFTNPATLQCGHTFCRKCLTNFTKTKPDAVRDKITPCAFGCEGTPVLNPSDPVEEWSKQMKPHFVINGLLEQFNSDKDCRKELPGTTNQKKPKYARCPDHGEDLKLICEACKEVICNTCCSLDHRQCKSILLIEAQFEAIMKTYLVDHMPKLEENVQHDGISIATMKSTVDSIKDSQKNVTSTIEKHFQKLIDQIRKRETVLLSELETIFNSLIHDFQEHIQLKEINLQMTQQRLQFMKETVKSDSLIDTCNMYLSLVSERGDSDKVRGQPSRVLKVSFTHKPHSLTEVLNRLHFGRLKTIYELGDRDQLEPCLRDVTVLVVGGEETMVVTEFNNKCVKSFFMRNKRTDHSRLPLDGGPCCISQYKDNQVLVTLPHSNQIVRVSVRPQLVLLSVINTSKEYVSLAVLSSSSLAAGSLASACVDILDMEGRVMRSIQRRYLMSLFDSPYYICIHPEGHLLVSDRGKRSVICVTLQGRVVWKYTPTGDRALGNPRGITTTPTGDVLFVDKSSNKIIQLSGSGQFVRDVFTSQDGLDKPMGLHLNKHNSLFVCDDNGQVFRFTT